MAANEAYLSVARSALDRRWMDRLDAAGHREALAIQQAHGLGGSLARILAGRGVTVGDVEDFLTPTLRRLMPDPATLRDMEPAGERIVRAIHNREKVAIFGDYDVDGATSAALLAGYLAHFGIASAIHIPDRITEGYGPNVEAIRKLREEGASLLVTVDCGVSSHEPLAEARRIGLDTVVLDHHLAPVELPVANAVVNPNRQDDVSGLGHLAACGVVFMTLVKVQAMLRSSTQPLPDLMAGLDLVALGTVADVVPLKGLNRAFVTQGLKFMRQRGRPGLAALMDAAGLSEPPEAWHLGFLLGPRINAGGRIGDAALGARLLTTADPVEAGRIAADLDRLNRERQTLEQLMLQQAEEMADADLAAGRGNGSVTIVGSPDWHPGVVGLVASRLKDRYRRPAVAIAWDFEKGQGVASARSIPGVDLGRAVRLAVEAGVILKGGGHAMAAGMTVAAGAEEQLRAFLDERLTVDVATELARNEVKVDAALTAAALTAGLAADVARAGPYGQGNPEPLFAFPAHRLDDVIPVGSAHIRIRFRDGGGAQAQGIAFRAQGQPLGEALMKARSTNVHLLGSLHVERWGGRERVDLRVVDIAMPAK
jgi:single-stranded-DNA-specific exonuclease